MNLYNTEYSERESTNFGNSAQRGGLKAAGAASHKQFGHIPDETLVRYYVNSRDQEAFIKLYERYNDKIYGHAMKLTGNLHDAEEIRQEVFLILVRKLSGFRGESMFSTWLYRVTKNACYQLLHERRRKLENEAPGAFSETGYYASRSRPCIERRADEILDIKENIRAVRDALERQSALNRLIFQLSEVQGFSNAEVCRAVRLSLPAVKSRILRIRLSLNKELRKKRLTGPEANEVKR